MAQKKVGGSTRNGRSSNPKYLGVKKYGGQYISTGGIIVKQRGSTILPGCGVKCGKDFTLFSVKSGFIFFHKKHKKQFVSIFVKNKDTILN
ncbi:UNVERIFIED_CONTAM: hypothetical protein GTU68_041197 [Idotea baltica]|nr:hypothetical protein [Idotea baltica]